MSYLDLINRYWQEMEIKGWTPVETNIYFRLLDICNKSGWKNPFTLSNPRAVALMAVTENTLAAGRDRLVMKGLIGFKKGSRRSESPVYCFPEKINGEWVFPDCFTSNIEVKQKVKPMTKQKVKQDVKPPTYNKIKNKTENILPKEISPQRTREDEWIECLDSWIGEFYDDKHQKWEDEMKMKFRVDDIRCYLPLFRRYVISNSLMDRINSVMDVRKYFSWRFDEFSSQAPLEILDLYKKETKNELFAKFCQWIMDKASNVARKILPLTEEEFLKLKDIYGSDMIAATILAINNRKDLVAKYYSLYQTLVQWLDRDFNQP